MDTMSPVESQSNTPVFWLHVPNTGTSFGNTLVQWACDAPLPNVVQAHKSDTAKACNWEHCKHHFVTNNPIHPNIWPIGDHISLGTQISVRSLHFVVSFGWERLFVRNWLEPVDLDSTKANAIQVTHMKAAFSRETRRQWSRVRRSTVDPAIEHHVSVALRVCASVGEKRCSCETSTKL
jgi:hypothetical protein